MTTRQQRRHAEREAEKSVPKFNPSKHADKVRNEVTCRKQRMAADAILGGTGATYTESNWYTKPTPEISDLLGAIELGARMQAKQREAFIDMVELIGGKVRGADIAWIPRTAFWKLFDSMRGTARFSIDGTTMNLFGFAIYPSIKDFYDRLIEDWHNGAGRGQGLSEYMGMSESEYAEWLVNP